MWATETIAGMGLDGRTLVTKIHSVFYTLYNMGTSPEPNLTILWSEQYLKTSNVSVQKYRLIPHQFNTKTMI